jgi:hypothetical protein
MADTIAARLRAAFSTIVEGMIELIEVVPIKANNREYTGIIIFVPEFSFGEVSAEARAKQVSIKRRYEHLAEVVRVLLGKAPDDLLRQWKEADEQFRVWIELESNWALERHREGNRAKLQTAAGAVEKILAVLGALGDHGVLLVPHGWNTAVGVAADLALTAAMPVARWVEYQTGVPYIEELIDPPFRLDKDGMLPVPTGPGLGINWNPEAIAKYSR